MVKKIKIFYYGRVWFLVLPFHIRRVDTCKEANCREGIVGAVRTTCILGQPGLFRCLKLNFPLKARVF